MYLSVYPFVCEHGLNEIMHIQSFNLFTFYATGDLSNYDFQLPWLTWLID